MAAPPRSVLVFCDLDNTLFEPRTFCLDRSRSNAFDRLERRHLRIVLCSIRTRVELELMQRELGLHQPFICEDGGALFVPRGYFGHALEQAADVAGYQAVEFGRDYVEIVDALHGIAGYVQTEIIGFDDMSVDEVAVESEVPLLQARLAKLRSYSEAFRIVDPSPAAGVRLLKAIRGAGFDCTKRGRYHYISGRHRDRARQMLRALYRKAIGPFITVAVGDDPANLGYLKDAEIPLVVDWSAADGPPKTDAARRAQTSAARTVGACAELILRAVDAKALDRSMSTSLKLGA
jgi:mannosyl-3-phosphoglycerate phosphatase